MSILRASVIPDAEGAGLSGASTKKGTVEGTV